MSTGKKLVLGNHSSIAFAASRAATPATEKRTNGVRGSVASISSAASAPDIAISAWVMTTSGFYGRYVETDGDVIVLETSDGTETLWTSRAIVSVGNPPFAPDTEDADPQDADTEKSDEADKDEDAKDLAVDSPEEGTAADAADEANDDAAAADGDPSEKN